MDKIIESLMWSVMGVLEVNLLIVGYMLGIIYLIYRTIRGKKHFKRNLIKLIKTFIDDLKHVFYEYKKLIMGA